MYFFCNSFSTCYPTCVKKFLNDVLDIGNSAFHSVINGCDHQENVLRYSIFCCNSNEQSSLPRNILGVNKECFLTLMWHKSICSVPAEGFLLFFWKSVWLKENIMPQGCDFSFDQRSSINHTYRNAEHPWKNLYPRNYLYQGAWCLWGLRLISIGFISIYTDSGIGPTIIEEWTYLWIAVIVQFKWFHL